MPVQDIKDSLERFQAAVKTGDGPGLTASLRELDALLAAHRGTLPPQLVHFLEGRSYAKAAAWLGVGGGFPKPASPPGGCGDH